MSTRVWIALGSNLGDRRATLEAAIEDLRASEGVEVLRVSPWVETAPVGGPAGQGPFLNGALEAETELSADELLRLLLAIEARHGRTRRVRNGPRTLDLDLLLYGNERIARDDLVVPHPRMEEREFVLEPLARVDRDLVLASGITVGERLAQLRRT